MDDLHSLASSYDTTPYPDYVFWFTHPEHLGMLGRLFGLKTAALTGARILEIGCAVGGNLIPMAMSRPEAHFVGCDLSSVQIAEAEELTKEAGLSNLRFFAGDACGLPEEYGNFDYVICHGVFSWVPPQVQHALLDVMKQRLNPNGIIFISYNTYPGHHMVDMLRRLTYHHTRELEAPTERIRSALGITHWLTQRTHTNSRDWRTPFLERELASMRESHTSAILHDYLAEHNHPFYFLDFVKLAGEHGLSYICNSSPWDMYVDNQEPELAQALHQLGDLLEQQQYLDFVSHTRFRRTLLCHTEEAPAPTVNAERIFDFYVGHALIESPSLEGIAESRPISIPLAKHAPLVVSHPLLRMTLYLLWGHGRRWPHFDELVQEVREALQAYALCRELTEQPELLRARLASQLLRAFFSEAVRFGLTSPPVTCQLPPYPCTGRYQRVQARLKRSQIANLCQEGLPVIPEYHTLLTLMDGTRHCDELAASVPDGQARLHELCHLGFVLDPALTEHYR